MTRRVYSQLLVCCRKGSGVNILGDVGVVKESQVPFCVEDTADAGLEGGEGNCVVCDE